MSDDQATGAEYASDSAVARNFNVHIKSLARWDARPELKFPEPIRINGRKYRRWDDIREFARRAAAAHASKP